jgi:hypothetical protein
MKESYTHITVILDRTGSMECIRDDIIGGFNAFLEEQQKLPWKATMTLVQFDSQDPYEALCRFAPVAEVPRLSRQVYVPRAQTPLLDAIGRGINDLDACLQAIPAGLRPDKIVVAIITDGQENASREFSRRQIERMIGEKTKQCGWQFAFLSSDLQAIEDARACGIAPDASLAYAHDGDGVKYSMSRLSKSTCAYRGSRAKKVTFDENDRRASGNATH